MHILLLSFLLNAFTASKVEKVIIKKVDFSIMTIANVSCEYFDFEFSWQMDTFRFESQEIIEKISSSINRSQKLPPSSGFDIRAKIFLIDNSGKQDSICLENSRSYLYNGDVMMFPDESLIRWVDSLKK